VQSTTQRGTARSACSAVRNDSRSAALARVNSYKRLSGRIECLAQPRGRPFPQPHIPDDEGTQSADPTGQLPQQSRRHQRRLARAGRTDDVDLALAGPHAADCDISLMAITETSASRSPKTIDGDRGSDGDGD
jgi:hypothetical protein